MEDIHYYGEDHIVDLNLKEVQGTSYKPTKQVCSNVPTEKNDSVFSHIPPRKKGKWIMVGA